MSTTTSAPTAHELATTILLAIDTTELPRFGDRKVFISGLHAFVNEAWGGIDRATFDRLLLDANRQGLVTLARADYVTAMDRDDVDASHIHDLGSDFHFVLDPAAR